MATCPKCQSQNIFISQGGVGFELYIKVLQEDGWMVSTPGWETHLCADCGYFENYLVNKEWLEKIKAGSWKNWAKAK